METELKHVQGRLQSMREEYETTLEELRAANEELQSTNEEYKSTLEELETSKEELQSINEELQTINQELKTKIEEVTHAHSDVQNLFIATDIATLFLDRDLRVKRYTPSAAELFNLMPPDKGRPIGHLRSNLLYEQLEADAQRVLAHLTPLEREIQSQNSRWFLVRMRPYRTLEDKIDGVVITFVDITTNKANEVALRDAKEYAESIVHTIPDALLVLEPDLRVQMANDAFYEIFQVDREATEGRLIYELGNGQWHIPALRTLLEEILPENKLFVGYEVEHTFEQIGRRAMLVNGRRLDHVQLILLAITDITERKRAEEALRASEDRQAFLLKLTDTLRPLADAAAIQGEACRLLGEHVGAPRVYYVEVQEAQETTIVRQDYVRNGLPSLVAEYPLAAFRWAFALYQQGRPVVITDVRRSALIPEADKAASAAAHMAWIAIPLIKHDKLVGALCVADIEPRQWRSTEIALATETAERIWAAIERANAEAALRESESRLRVMIENLPGGVVFIVDRDLRYLRAEGEALHAIGFQTDNFVGKTIVEAFPPEVVERYEARFRQALAGETFTDEHELYGRFYLSRGMPLHAANGEIYAALVVSYDITDRKQAEAALKQLNATLEQQVDTRTAQVRALAASLTMAEQEERQRISQMLHDDLQQLLYGIQMRIMSIMTDIQQRKHDMLSDYAQEAYTWLGDAIQTTRHLTVDLSPPILKDEGLVEALHWLATQMAALNHLQVTLQIDKPCRIEDEAMRVLLFQIVRELLFNVVKHAGANQATVVLTEKAGQCLIQISDTGRGFDVASAETKPERGFGLFSVRERLKLFGGGMTIQSAPGQGTQITVTVPLSMTR